MQIRNTSTDWLGYSGSHIVIQFDMEIGRDWKVNMIDWFAWFDIGSLDQQTGCQKGRWRLRERLHWRHWRGAGGRHGRRCHVGAEGNGRRRLGWDIDVWSRNWYSDTGVNMFGAFLKQILFSPCFLLSMCTVEDNFKLKMSSYNSFC